MPLNAEHIIEFLEKRNEKKSPAVQEIVGREIHAAKLHLAAERERMAEHALGHSVYNENGKVSFGGDEIV